MMLVTEMKRVVVYRFVSHMKKVSRASVCRSYMSLHLHSSSLHIPTGMRYVRYYTIDSVLMTGILEKKITYLWIKDTLLISI